MKITKTRTIPAVVAQAEQTVEYEVDVCDICEKRQVDHQCKVCGRQLCRRCACRDWNCLGDYPDIRCTTCLALWHDGYLDRVNAIEGECEIRTSWVMDELKAKSLATKNA